MGILAVDALPFVDLTTLTQTEIQSLSAGVPFTFDLRRTDDLVIPSIDPSQFNESAGSSRQTPETHHHHHHHPLRHRLPGLLPSSKPLSGLDNTETNENRAIISSLKMLLKTLPDFQTLDFTSTPSSTLIADTTMNLSERDSLNLGKRKRGRQPNTKAGSPGEEVETGLQMVNKNGVAVDLVALESRDDPYGAEIRKRTETITGNEEALLGFMRDLGGQWCSRRRKRKIVDANIFGDVLPIGWKVLLGLKRREGRASVYCRRYVSPAGRHFVSCKEVSAYLRSYNQSHLMGPESHAAVAMKEDNQGQHDDRERGLATVESENLEDVKINDLFDCHKCNLTFNEKDAYLQHLLTIHQRTTRRYRIGSSVADGVIIREGKFECQFCHKVFQERRRYNGHVGIHVRNYVRGVEEAPGLLNLQRSNENPMEQKLPTRSSKMDALIEIAHNSILETEDKDEAKEILGSDKQYTGSDTDIPSDSDHGSISDSPLSEPESENVVLSRTAGEDLSHQDSRFMNADEKSQKVDSSSNDIDTNICGDATISSSLNEHTSETMDEKNGLASGSDEHDQSDIEKGRGNISLTTGLSSDCSVSVLRVDSNVDGSHSYVLQHPKHDEAEACKSIELLVDLSKDGPVADIEIGKLDETYDGKVLQAGVSENPLSLLQPLHDVSLSNATFQKGDDAFCSIARSDGNVTVIKELSLDEIDQFGFGTGDESTPLSEVHIELESGVDLVNAYGSSVQFGPEVELGMSGSCRLTSCVWCGVEFNHDAIDSEVQSDSVGYMCQTCKTKISGQFSALNGGSD